MIKYRLYQAQIVDRIKAAWAAAHRVVLAVQATRTGKTVVFCGVMADEPGASVAIAHRQELISQMSLALAKNGVMHRIIAQEGDIRRIIHLHVREVGASFYDPRAKAAVAGVKSLISKAKRDKTLITWAQFVRLWVVDEGHHCLEENEWGKAVQMFPNARGLLVTATPDRADGKGLGRHADGLADEMVIGLQMREAINEGWLLDYRIFAPPGDFHRPDQPEDIGSTGDYKPAAVKKAIRQSHIIGDIVTHYQRIAPGKKAIAYLSDVETATDVAEQFRASGIPAAVVSAETPDTERARIMRQFATGELLVLTNVDLFGEGVDLPDMEVVIMGRPTESFSLYCQQFNRASTVAWGGPPPETAEARRAAIAASSKPHAIIIDHVGNVVRHGLPDARTEWTMDAKQKQSRGASTDAVPIRSCLNVECMQIYERFYPVCPYCGHKPEPASRAAPEFVDGDLAELDPAVLAAMRGAVEKVDMLPADYRSKLQNQRVPAAGVNANVRRHIERQEAQETLREMMAWWAGHHKAAGRSQSEMERRFYHQFQVDALSAKALNAKEAANLAARVLDAIGGMS